MKKFIFALFTLLVCTASHAQTETIQWYFDGQLYDTTTCESGGDIDLPLITPTKRGYTFQGWWTYTPIEYLESTGTQYIDTGYIPNNNTRAIVDMKNKTSNVNAWGVGSRGSDSTRFSSLIGLKYGPNILRSDFGAEEKSGTASINLSNVRLLIDKNKNVMTTYSGGTVVSTITNTNATFTANSTLFLFALNYNNGLIDISSNVINDIYSAKIYDNNTLVRDFVPVLDYNGTPCMFDKVSETFFYNQGTGDFIAGPVVSE